jgi:flagellar biosynthesis protein FlhG
MEAERAYQRLRELYADDSLATYALLDSEERRERLNAIEQAFREIVAGNLQRPVVFPERPETGEGADDDTPLPDPTLHPGHYLCRLRQRAGLQLRDLAERTKISPGKLEYIEQERLALLPPPVYLRGFVLEYARCLGVPDPRQLAECYLRLLAPADREH